MSVVKFFHVLVHNDIGIYSKSHLEYSSPWENVEFYDSSRFIVKMLTYRFWNKYSAFFDDLTLASLYFIVNWLEEKIIIIQVKEKKVMAVARIRMMIELSLVQVLNIFSLSILTRVTASHRYRQYSNENVID